ncbi:MAG: hypothetical protein CMP67_09030 [Flavobacteriales bacterium]|nr:hypothetical protein [Flavobacteriales bacterium]|tara:strand:+ start:3563 stop:4213 length:651 start_codon:yes stop_codon:yes gene_type:complete
MSQISVLHAENYSLAAEGLKRILSEHNISGSFFCVKKSEELESGILAYEPDLLIINYASKGYFSIEDLEFISASYPNLNILVIANDSSTVRIRKVLEIGVKGYLTNNSDKDEIVLAIRKILSGEKYFSSEIVDIILNKKEPYPVFSKKNQILTHREQQIVKNIALGKSNKQIADLLGISHHTVHTHRKNAMKKLSIKTSTELTLYAVDYGLIELAY